MAHRVFDRVKETTATTGTGTVTMAGAVAGFRTLAAAQTAAGGANGDTFDYLILSGAADWEIGIGTIATAGTTFTRSVSWSTNSNAAITLAGVSTVMCIRPAGKNTGEVQVNATATTPGLITGWSGSTYVFGVGRGGATGPGIDIEANTDIGFKVAAGGTVNAGARKVNIGSTGLFVYNAFTNVSNNEYAEISWASNVLSIGTNQVGTGVARNLQIRAGGTNRLDYGVTNSGKWTTTVDLGVGGLLAIGPSVAFSSSFPALKRSSAILEARLADDSAFADFRGGNLISGVAGKGLQIQSGTGARAGNATLVAGTVTVTNTTVDANTLIILARKTAGGTLGNLTYTLSAGASFTITSSSGTDTSVVTYLLVRLN